MTAKEYLKQIEALDIKIRQKQDQLDCLKETAGGNAAIRYDKLNVQITVAPDMMERNVLRMVELEEKIWADKLKMETLKDQIIDQIQSLEDERYIDLLFRRYVKYQKFEQIALDMSYDYVYIRELHGEALGAFEQEYKDILHNPTK
jgi:hypothetical protein